MDIEERIEKIEMEDEKQINNLRQGRKWKG